MFYSMTGVGIAEETTENYKISILIKSLNSKGIEISTRLPFELEPLEFQYRKIISSTLLRGKISLSLTIESLGEKQIKFNEKRAQELFSFSKEINNALHKEKIEEGKWVLAPFLKDIVKFSDEGVKKQVFNKKLLDTISRVLKKAVEALVKYREKEGKALYHDINKNISEMEKGLKQIILKHQGEKKRVPTAITNKMKLVLKENAIDKNRLEQEIFHYIYKIDINEEVVRLKEHLALLKKEEKKKTPQKGKQLLFICQEILRELNTIGSKTSSAEIQHVVVKQKTALDMVREQLANVL